MLQAAKILFKGSYVQKIIVSLDSILLNQVIASLNIAGKILQSNAHNA